MKNTILALMTLVALSSCSQGSFPADEAPVGCSLTGGPADVDGLPNVLIIGDSISIGYTPSVRTKVNANVVHNYCNAQRSSDGVRRIDLWLSQRDHWDVVTFNHGIWDIVETQTPENYYANMKIIGAKIKAKSNKVIFFTTTVLPKVDPARFEAFRAAAAQAMNELGIEIIDLNAYSQSIISYQNADQVHFYGEGDALLGDFVSQAINQKLSQ